MKKILIVQSIPEWLTMLKNAISKEFPAIEIECSDSFDYAVSLIKENEDLLVICSDEFHDKYSRHSSQTSELPDELKDGDSLARLVKERNEKAKIFVFSSYQPISKIWHDDYIRKCNDKIEESIELLLEKIKNIQ